MLRGSAIRNTLYCIGFVIYTGPETKIMMNAKKPPTKISRVQRMMNKMLYSVNFIKIFKRLGVRISTSANLNICSFVNVLVGKEFEDPPLLKLG